MLRDRLRLPAVLVAYLALRAWLATTPGYPPDVGQFKLWALEAEQDGLAALYGGGAEHDFSRYDYPPLYAYVLRAIGWAYSFVEPDALARRADSTLLTVLVKLPALLADLAVAALLAAIARRAQGGSGAAGGRAPALAPLVLAWLLNPALLLDSGHWGQPDSIHAGFALAAFAWLGGALGPARGTAAGVAGAWCLLALAALMKPLAAPLFPLLLAASLRIGGWRRTLRGAAAAVATAALLFAPFIARHGLAAVAQRVAGDVTIMSYTSVNAHNAWWLVGPWRDSEARWLGPFSATQLGLALVLAALAALVALALRRDRQRRAGLHPAQLLAIAAGSAAAFFLLATHLHENHLFGALPLLLGAIAAAPAGSSSRRAAWMLFAALSFGVAWNVAAHDFEWRHAWPLSLGAGDPYLGDAPEQPLARGEHLAGTLGTLFNLASAAAFGAFLFGGALVRLAWRPGLPAGAHGAEAADAPPAPPAGPAAPR